MAHLKLLKLQDFSYDLSKKFIAQNPAVPRDSSKLMIFDTSCGKIFHKKFRDISTFLNEKDVLVLNRSKVIPARILFDFKGRVCEVFLLKALSPVRWQVLVRPGKMFQTGAFLKFSDRIAGKIVRIESDGTRIMDFSSTRREQSERPSIKTFLRSKNTITEKNLTKELYKLGTTPLPPYIVDSKASFDQYQTIYAREKGSVAAPTAGLHFTENLLHDMKSRGVSLVEVILHVGLGTFQPVKTENISEHIMHEEEFEMTKKAAKTLNLAKKRGKRIIAVGTTSVRVLESSYLKNSGFVESKSATDIFIYPGKHHWQAVDALITNFHLPKSTLLMLVASFLESKGVKDPVEKLFELYELAKKMNYRFFSFGDAMFIY